MSKSYGAGSPIEQQIQVTLEKLYSYASSGSSSSGASVNESKIIHESIIELAQLLDALHKEINTISDTDYKKKRDAFEYGRAMDDKISQFFKSKFDSAHTLTSAIKIFQSRNDIVPKTSIDTKSVYALIHSALESSHVWTRTNLEDKIKLELLYGRKKHEMDLLNAIKNYLEKGNNLRGGREPSITEIDSFTAAHKNFIMAHDQFQTTSADQFSDPTITEWYTEALKQNQLFADKYQLAGTTDRDLLAFDELKRLVRQSLEEKSADGKIYGLINQLDSKNPKLIKAIESLDRNELLNLAIKSFNAVHTEALPDKKGILRQHAICALMYRTLAKKFDYDPLRDQQKIIPLELFKIHEILLKNLKLVSQKDENADISPKTFSANILATFALASHAQEKPPEVSDVMLDNVVNHLKGQFVSNADQYYKTSLQKLYISHKAETKKIQNDLQFLEKLLATEEEQKTAFDNKSFTRQKLTEFRDFRREIGLTLQPEGSDKRTAGARREAREETIKTYQKQIKEKKQEQEDLIGNQKKQIEQLKYETDTLKKSLEKENLQTEQKSLLASSSEEETKNLVPLVVHIASPMEKSFFQQCSNLLMEPGKDEKDEIKKDKDRKSIKNSLKQGLSVTEQNTANLNLAMIARIFDQLPEKALATLFDFESNMALLPIIFEIEDNKTLINNLKRFIMDDFVKIAYKAILKPDGSLNADLIKFLDSQSDQDNKFSSLYEKLNTQQKALLQKELVYSLAHAALLPIEHSCIENYPERYQSLVIAFPAALTPGVTSFFNATVNSSVEDFQSAELAAASRQGLFSPRRLGGAEEKNKEPPKDIYKLFPVHDTRKDNDIQDIKDLLIKLNQVVSNLKFKGKDNLKKNLEPQEFEKLKLIESVLELQNGVTREKLINAGTLLKNYHNGYFNVLTGSQTEDDVTKIISFAKNSSKERYREIVTPSQTPGQGLS
ncbi:MAG TPA: hypothetical protein VLI69_00495 [Gammaproteobacteria bacterium]|nr:hypothetical protein [Gammaproteobacteria bacterium]